jgi:hypothetical protein
VVWIHLEDGLTHLRACQIGEVVIVDNREPPPLYIDSNDGYIYEVAPIAELKDGGTILAYTSLSRQISEVDLVEEEEPA